MERKYVSIILFLVVGLAIGFGAATLIDRGKGAVSGEIQNAELKVGDQAPDFDLYDSSGAKVRLSDFLGEKNVVLAFYPAAWTPV